MKYTLWVTCLLLALYAFQCAPTNKSASTEGPLPMPPRNGEKMDGLTMVAPPQPFSSNPMLPVQDVNASWIAVIPYAFTRPDQPAVRYAESGGWQWWGESPIGAAETIRLAHKAGIKVMLKPQVYVPRGWTGSLDFKNDEEWEQWESGYTRYILHFAQIADTTKADLFCVGTEFNNAIQKRPGYWNGLIKKIKEVYKGKLTYSSNWDDWERVPFWSQLDYIGLGGYFPLVEADTPKVADLCRAWQPIKDRMAQFSQAQNKPILFTEFGYLSVDNCGWRNWELEQGIKTRPINQLAQANCVEALFPNGQGHEGYPERDYTPQGKLAEQVLKQFYGPRKQ
jgi:hypothetical protein